MKAETGSSEKVRWIIKKGMENAFHRLIPTVSIEDVKPEIRKFGEDKLF